MIKLGRRFNTSRIVFTISFVALFAIVNIVSASMSSDNYQIWADAVSTGGTETATSGSGYTLGDTAGEVAVDPSTSNGYTLDDGFRSFNYFSGAETLTFSVSDSSLDFGELSRDTTATASHTLTVGTNASSGVSVTYAGTTLTSDTDSIPAIGSTASVSAIKTGQFGFNVIRSTSSGTLASATSSYNNSSLYAFSSGDQIISASSSVDNTTFSMNYIANITGSEGAGTYTASITYSAVANF